MRRKKEIKVTVNYPNDKNDLKKLEHIKARIIIEILKEKYGDKVLDEYINSMREKMEDYS